MVNDSQTTPHARSLIYVKRSYSKLDLIRVGRVFLRCVQVFIDRISAMARGALDTAAVDAAVEVAIATTSLCASSCMLGSIANGKPLCVYRTAELGLCLDTADAVESDEAVSVDNADPESAVASTAVMPGPVASMSVSTFAGWAWMWKTTLTLSRPKPLMSPPPLTPRPVSGNLTPGSVVFRFC